MAVSKNKCFPHNLGITSKEHCHVNLNQQELGFTVSSLFLTVINTVSWVLTFVVSYDGYRLRLLAVESGPFGGRSSRLLPAWSPYLGLPSKFRTKDSSLAWPMVDLGGGPKKITGEKSKAPASCLPSSGS